MNFIIKKVLGTVLGRWVTGTVVALLLSGGAWKWYDFKDDLVVEGQQQCIQEINKETVEQLQAALAAEKSARVALTANLIAAARVNQEVRERKNALGNQLSSLQTQMENQRERDPDYKEWGDAHLPDGVADRLRSAQAGRDPGTVRDDPD